MLAAFGPRCLILSTPEGGWVSPISQMRRSQEFGAPFPPPPRPQGMGHWDLNPDLPRAFLQAMGAGVPCTGA